MTFRISGLNPRLFSDLAGLPDQELADRGVARMISTGSGFPCRITLRDLPAGASALLMNYAHQPAQTPFQSRHAIFVGEDAAEKYDAIDQVPEMLQSRLLSIRSFDAQHMMIDADVVEGVAAAEMIERLLANPDAQYLHVHFAKHGCFAAKAERP